MLFGSTSRRFGTISIFPSTPIATYRIMLILGKVVQDANAGRVTLSQRSVCRDSSHRPLVGVVCRMLRAGKHMGSWRWQQLGRHALDLLTPAWMDDNSFESNLRGAAVRSGVHGELMRKNLGQQPRIR